MQAVKMVLSDKELQLLTLISKGSKANEMAAQTGISTSYVYTIKRWLRLRFNAQTDAQLVTEAIQRGYLPSEGGNQQEL